MFETPTSQRALQVVQTTASKCSVSKKEMSARDFSIQFKEQVIARFVTTQSIKQTGRDFSIPARVVSEILLLATFRRGFTMPVRRAA